MNDIDDYLNQLRSDLDNQLDGFGDNGQNRSDQSADDHASEIEEFKFCPKCGNKVSADANFCSSCGFNFGTFNEPEEESREEETDNTVTGGILFTNTKVLAEKYNTDREYVIDMFDNIISSCEKRQQYWKLLDVGEYDISREKAIWLDYNELLSTFIEKYYSGGGMKVPVFIIGGDDVIPIPMVENAYESGDVIPCDMCYCFQGHFFSDLWDGGDHTITDDFVRNTVSRLPLEDGKLENSIREDIEGYFNRCSLYYDSGIPATQVMMETNAEWIPASKTMSEHLPLQQGIDDSEYVFDGMYVSPPIRVDEMDTTEVLDQTLMDSNMLLFNLHGSDAEGSSGFYSEDSETGEYPEAFGIDLLDDTRACVINTVACFGARYHGFARNDSMLLSSLYNHAALLYAGSLISVPMCTLNIPEGVEVHEGSGSEHLMPIYCMEQYSGITAGEAMMKAKLEYFNTFRHMERDDFSLSTIMMFGLYGNPMLRLQRDEKVLQRAKQCHILPTLPQQEKLKAMPIRMKRTQRVLSKEQLQNQSLLSQVRSAVDDNINAIHQSVQKNLYDVLGLEPRWLNHVDAFSIPDGYGGYEEGYSYAYDDKSKKFGGKSWVEVDTKGSIKRVIKNK